MLHLFAFLVTILVIVTIHEWGHYLAMRAFNVRVLTFSIGFGPRLFGWRNAAGTDFQVSAIPLGGYVKPLDRRDSEVPVADEEREFSAKPAWQRVITYAAGPLANLVLALLLYWLVLLGGKSVVAPVVAEPPAHSAAAQAGLMLGDEWIAVAGEPVMDWSDVMEAWLRHIGEPEPIAISVRNDGELRELSLPLESWTADPEQNPYEALGIIRISLPVMGDILPDGAAAKAGMQSGDRVLAVDDQAVESWQQWVTIVRARPSQQFIVRVQRGEQQLLLSMEPRAIELDGQVVGQVGVAHAARRIHYGPLSAIPAAFEQLSDQVGTMLSMIAKLVKGALSLKTLGGPLTIADVAGQTAAMGLISFISFLAYISVLLGVVNLMPIPILDGGWIMFGLFEMLTGRAPSERVVMTAQTVGMVLMFSLMSLAIYNDLVRQFG